MEEKKSNIDLVKNIYPAAGVFWVENRYEIHDMSQSDDTHSFILGAGDTIESAWASAKEDAVN